MRTIWAVRRENLSSCFGHSKTQISLLSYRDLLEIEISLVSSLDLILYNKRITKALIRLRVCAGWSGIFCSLTTGDRFPRMDAHMMFDLY